MEKKHILLGVCGGIAAYKSAYLVRLLKKQGHDVTVVMSRAAEHFISAKTFHALSGNRVLRDEDNGKLAMAHIDLTRQADVFLIAPASANTIAKMAGGLADNLITELVAARTCPLVVAPAMNQQMWHNPANQRNIQQLQQDGIVVISPNNGEQACGEVGMGRLPEAEELADYVSDVWYPKILLGKKVLITLGGTFEAIDPVRGITNLSSGQMGIALARACRQAGAEVSLVCARIAYPLPVGMKKVSFVDSAQEMYDAVHQLIANQNIFIGVAAVADYAVKNQAHHKIKKEVSGSPPHIELVENPDIIASVSNLENPPFCVGFAAESEQLLPYARSKKAKKKLPMLIANRVDLAMGKTNSEIVILDNEKELVLPEMDKARSAQAIVARLAELLI